MRTKNITKPWRKPDGPPQVQLAKPPRPLVLPQLSINGTDKQSLVDQQRAVLTALDSLIDAMARAMPHGRDYQYRPEEYPLARDAWVERMSGVVDLKREIERHGVAILESGQ